MNTFRNGLLAIVSIVVSALPLTTLAADGAKSFTDAMVSGDANLNLRYRYEFVDQGGFDKNANASTLRIRLNYRTAQWRKWSSFVEMDYLGEVLLNNFNSAQGTSSLNRTQYPTVADPKGADLNQLYFDYRASDDLLLRFGRQRILLDNERYVGGVGWRQNEQTFDGASLTFNGWSNTKVFYSYVGNVNRIFGDTVDAGDHNVDTHLLNAKIGLNDDWSVTPYFYYIDNKDAAASSTSTFGARLAGKTALSDGSLSVVAELATQSDTANNPVSYDAAYYRVDVDWAMSNGLGLGVGIESLGGNSNNGGMAYRTPLATLHAFQGWADTFLATPAAGINDVTVNAKLAVEKWQLKAIYHDFSAESGSANFGTEIDFAATRKLGDRYGLLLKAAFFNSDNVAYVDTNKLWVMLTAGF
ncbi:MAG: alginate export family protein [Gammaproteobacteria bacterium]|nr:alginate export family protein [Gammaproteobacteria bacterium]